MTKFVWWIAFFALAEIQQVTKGVVKKFVASSDLTNPLNWRRNEVPCTGSKAQIQRNPPFQLNLGSDLAMQTLELANDVELLLGDSASLVLSEDRNTCSNLDTVFEINSKGYWWDPASWDCDECTSATPDLDRVPCRRDRVHLPNATQTVYRLLFTPPTPSVTKLNISDQSMSTATFFTYATSTAIGKETIIHSSHSHTSISSHSFLYIEGDEECSDATGCSCHSSLNFNTKKEEICKHILRKCPKPSCRNPVKMVGFCCPMCGVDISISTEGSLSLTLVKNVLVKVLSAVPKEKTVDGFVSKMYDGLVHVYFTPKYPQSEYKQIALQFKEKFNRDLNAEGKYNISLKVAEGSLALQLKEQAAESNSSTAAVVTVLFLVIVVGILLFIYRKRRVSKESFSFRRMSNSFRFSRRSSVNPVSVRITSIPTAEGRSFSNPTFEGDSSISTVGIETFESDQTGVTSIISESKVDEESTGHEIGNPLYNVQQKSAISLQTLQSSVEENKVEELIEEKEDEMGLVMVDIEKEPDLIQSDSEDETDSLEILAKSRLHSVFEGSPKKEKEADILEEEAFPEETTAAIDEELIFPSISNEEESMA